ncbi:MAG: hypothetical protein Q7V20_13305 [Aquabacterium sp.]|uniref:hypothetical protein n=1 Tax=Aquabacterium sp. TaxID=1872578 RepID=UPI0027202766|nr:hypothetical protein [Aquabacterium sp.]MDO9004423.1 hypothetical protein [Aquabacterium sp.]
MNDRTQTLLQDSDAFDSGAAVDRVAQRAHDAIDSVAAKAKPAVERVHSAASQAADALHAKADTLGELEGQWLDSARAHIREQPLTSMAIGLLAGVLLSRLAR